MTKTKQKLISDSIKNTLFGDVESCGLFPVIFRVSIYGIILYLLIFQIQDKINVVVYFSAVTAIAELCWCRLEFCKKLIWHLISFLILLGFLFLILAQTNTYWNKGYAIEHGIRNIVQDAPSAIIVADKYGIIKDMNLNAESITGWDKKDLVGLPITTLVDPTKIEHHNQALSTIVKRIESSNKPEALWVFNNRLNHSFRVITKYGYSRPVKLYVLAVSFPNYFPDKYNVDFYAIIESDD
jgi:PAS domain S-box-containing protein